MTAYSHPLAIAPMIDWTDRFCRLFHRRLTQRALLYTEMVVADAILHGDRDRLLGFSAEEHPVAVQLGGSNPAKLAAAARIAASYGYDEINLNVGCPSDRVQSGTFGACLMRTPALVGDCVAAMRDAVDIPVTVKCRIGVDEQDPEASLDALAEAVVDAGAVAIWVHARKAWLQGLSPRENRDIPPLDYDRVYRLKQARPDVFIGINGGVKTLDEAAAHLRHVDGVMLGRAAYQTPTLLADADRIIYGESRSPNPFDIVSDMLPQVEAWLGEGRRLGPLIRPMLGLFHGAPGARRWRQMLTVEGSRPGAGVEVVERALAAVMAAMQAGGVDFAGNPSETEAPDRVTA